MKLTSMIMEPLINRIPRIGLLKPLHQKPHHSPKVRVCCEVDSIFIIGLYFLEEDCATLTVVPRVLYKNHQGVFTTWALKKEDRSEKMWGSNKKELQLIQPEVLWLFLGPYSLPTLSHDLLMSMAIQVTRFIYRRFRFMEIFKSTCVPWTLSIGTRNTYWIH